MLPWAWIRWKRKKQSTWAFVWFNCSARKRVESPIPPPATKTFKMATKNLQLVLQILSSAYQRSPYPKVWFKVFSPSKHIVVEVLQCERGTHHKRALWLTYANNFNIICAKPFWIDHHLPVFIAVVWLFHLEIDLGKVWVGQLRVLE